MATIVIPGLQHLTDDRRRFGLQKAVAGFLYRGAQRLVKLRVNELMSRPLAGVDALDAPPGIEGLEYRALTPAEVRAFAVDRSNDLDVAMADRLEAGCDWCFAALAGDRLVNYSWYALGSIESLHCHVALSFPADTVYLYKAFTHPDFRGAGVHRATFVRASRRLVTLGLQRVVLIIDYANWHSLRSHQRLGFRTLGLIITAGRGPCVFEHHPRAGKKFGLRFGAEADLSDRQAAVAAHAQGLHPSAERAAGQLGFARLSLEDQPVATLLPPGLDRCQHNFQETAG
jgi:GNAT superfamily N-acetyltransferase